MLADPVDPVVPSVERLDWLGFGGISRVCLTDSENRLEEGKDDTTPGKSFLPCFDREEGERGYGLHAQRKALTEYLNGGPAQLRGEFVEVESVKRNAPLQLAIALARCYPVVALSRRPKRVDICPQ
jgi:hypothetical protein